MWELDHKEGWMLKTWCFQAVMLEKTFENPLNFKEIKPVNPKGNQSWIFIGRTDAEAEVPILCPPDGKSRLTGKNPDAWKYWRQEEKWDTRCDGWMASLTQWTWVWARTRRWWTGKPGVLQSMESQRVRQDWATEQQKIQCLVMMSQPDVSLGCNLFTYFSFWLFTKTALLLFSR